MGSMKDLLGDAPVSYPERPGFKERTTSKSAADAIAGDADNLRCACLNVVERAGPSGRTADEVASILGLSVLTIRPRISELRALGRIEPRKGVGARRRNASGASAIVWINVDAERASRP